MPCVRDFSSVIILSATRLVAGDVCAIDLNVDRRRQTEVKRLSDDVGWQEIEGDSGKFAMRKLIA